MKKYMILAAGALLTLSSCSTISHSPQAAAIQTELFSLAVADLDVQPKAETTVEFKWSPLSTVSLSEQKKTAMATLLNESGADILVEPNYEIKRRGLFRGGSVTVSGYPASYTNFRKMTSDDAEKIAALNGTLTCQSTVAPIYPFINTTARKPAKRKAKDSFGAFKSTPDGGSFANLLIGPTANTPSDAGLYYGLMYGNYGKKWGWYVKGALSTVKCNDSESYESKHKTTPSLTAGVIKTLGKHWNIMLGAGIGGYFCTEEQRHTHYDYYYDYSYDSYRYVDQAKFSIPVEFMAQYHVKHFNVMVGVNYATPCGTSDYELRGDGNVNLFVSAGYTF
ncbi:MAG: lipoprotein [Bacteroides sp.]|nr:lipoprotein [Bacteroides sp.]MCM1378965.1 lipoprotein [Bacteroides sp.]MCM1445581.1 lipoprotein [Prevotella sp.]